MREGDYVADADVAAAAMQARLEDNRLPSLGIDGGYHGNAFCGLNVGDVGGEEMPCYEDFAECDDLIFPGEVGDEG